MVCWTSCWTKSGYAGDLRCHDAAVMWLWWMQYVLVHWVIFASGNGSWLTHWGRDNTAAISQTTHSNTFSWMKMLYFRLKFHWSLFLRVQLTISHHWFRWWLSAGQATSHYLNQWWFVHWCIYASLGLNEFTETLGSTWIECSNITLMSSWWVPAFWDVVCSLMLCYRKLSALLKVKGQYILRDKMILMVEYTNTHICVCLDVPIWCVLLSNKLIYGG